MKNWLNWLAILVVLGVGIVGGVAGDRLWNKDKDSDKVQTKEVLREVLKEENAVIDVVDKVTPSVVTVGVKKTQRILNRESFLFDPFGFFGNSTRPQVEEKQIEQDIGSGFVLSKEGLVVTNKHVVGDLQAEYSVITYGDEEL